MSVDVTKSQASNKRPDIQGLRAIAVLAVVIFHARLPLPGGFIGVDVFFVISGFVITGMLQREWDQNGKIRLGRFWRRRFLRLTPALAVVIAFAILVAGVLMFPAEQRMAIQTGMGALALVANVVIARNTGGYFDEPAATNPLLNTWSLSVEEQFYLIFPFVLLGAWMIARRYRRLRWTGVIAVAALGICSLALALASHTDFMSLQGVTWLNFYSPIVRVWEFAAGCLLAIAVARRGFNSTSAGIAAGLSGVFLLGLGLIFINEATPFPGVWTLLPVSAAILLLLAGTGSRNSVSTALSSKSLQYLGDRSYSIYLWHWPLIVFAAFLGVTHPIALALVAAVSFIPAFLSYRWIEQPLRNLHGIGARKFWVTVVSVLAVPVVAALIVVSFLHPRSLYEGEVGTHYLDYIAEHSYPCALEQAPSNQSRCRQSQESMPISVAILGDSHAEHLFSGMADTLPEVNTAYVYLPNWPFDTSENSNLTFDQVAQTQSIKTVIIAARWLPEITDGSEVTSEVGKLASAGKRVFLANDSPYFNFHAQECKYQRALFLKSICSESSADFDALHTANIAGLESVAAQFAGVSLLDTGSGFCSEGQCRMTRGDELLFADHGHLNELGSREVIERLIANDQDFSISVS